MSVTQTVEVPASHRLVLDVPREVPAGTVILTFTPAAPLADAEYLQRKAREARDAEIFKLHADELNAEALDVLSYQSLDL